MKKILLILLAVIVVGGMLLVSCGKAEETPTSSPTKTTTPTSTPTATSTPTQTGTSTPTATATSPGLGDLARPAGGNFGGRLVLASAGNILNIGNIKLTAGPMDAMYAMPCVETLVILDKDGNFQPWLAERFEIADDYSSFTFYLREGINFTDGTPFNAEAVKYVMDVCIANASYPNYGLGIESPVIINDYTVKINFANGQWNWDVARGYATWWGMYMFSPKFLAENDDDYLKWHAVGTGPFILKEYIRDQKLIYDKNPDYWRGEPYLDGLDYEIIPDPTTQLLAYKAGELHFLGIQLKDINRLKDEGFGIIESEDFMSVPCLIPSSANPDSPLADVRVRQAVQYAIDQESIIAGITYGYGHLCQQEFPFEPYINADVVGYPYDPQKARDLLAEAGVGPGGVTFDMWVVEGTSMDTPLALKDMFEQVGIHLNVNVISYPESSNQIFGAGWDGFMYSGAFVGRTIDPGFSCWIFLSPGMWDSTYKPPEIQALMADGKVEPDVSTRTAIYQEINRMMTEQCLHQYLYWSGTFSSISPFINGYTGGQYKEFFVWTFAYFTD
jgi:peptide/nickel transport system substrate-binding protein